MNLGGWDSWDQQISQPTYQYGGWDPVEGIQTEQADPEQEIHYFHDTGPGFSADFDCTFTFPEGPGETSRSAKQSHQTEDNRYQLRPNPPTTESSPYVYYTRRRN